MNEVVAKVTAWSLSISANGVAPRVGYYGEEFERSSYRYGFQGQVLALGWKTFGLEIISIFDLSDFGKQSLILALNRHVINFRIKKDSLHVIRGIPSISIDSNSGLPMWQ